METKKRKPFVFDRTLREILGEIPVRFFELLFGSPPLKILPVTYPRVGEFRPDFLVLLGDGRVVHLEVQSYPDPSFPWRMLAYRIVIVEVYKKQPEQILLWVGEKRCPIPDGIQEPGLSYRYRVVDPRSYEAETLLKSPHPADQLLAVLCQRGEGFWEHLGRRLLEHPPSLREEMVQKLEHLLKLRRDAFQEYLTFAKEGTMPITIPLEQDPFYHAGVKKGLLLNAQELVVEALKVRFSRVPVALVRRIQGIEDREFLKELLRTAIQAKSLKEFEAVLKKGEK